MHAETRFSKRPRKMDIRNDLPDKPGRREREEDSIAGYNRTQVDRHQATDDHTIPAVINQTTSVVACKESKTLDQTYWHRVCKAGLANFVRAERDEDENVPTVINEIDRLGDGNLNSSVGCGAGEPLFGQDALSDPGTPLVQVRAVHCRLDDDIVDGLRQGCVAVERDEGLRGRSFLVPAKWGADGCRCAMEALAMEVFVYHTRGMEFDRECSGAEWWVQVLRR